MLVVIGVVAIMIRGNFVSSTELVSAVISRRIAHNRFDSIDSSNGPVSPYPGSSVSEVEILETGDNSRMSRATSGVRHLTREDIRIKKQIQLDKWRMCEIVKVVLVTFLRMSTGWCTYRWQSTSCRPSPLQQSSMWNGPDSFLDCYEQQVDFDVACRCAYILLCVQMLQVGHPLKHSPLQSTAFVKTVESIEVSSVSLLLS